MGNTDVWLRQGDGTPKDVRLYYFEEVVGGAPVVEVFDYIALADVPWLVSPVFVTDALHLLDAVYRMFGDIEVIDESWAWLDTFVEPSATPISESSPFKQNPWLQILSKAYNWYWIIVLTPILDVIIKEGGVREDSIIIDLPEYCEKNKPQYLGSADDLIFVRIRGTLDSIRQIDVMNQSDYISLRIRSNGVTWWQGRVHLIEWQGIPKVSPENLVDIETTGKGVAYDDARQMIGMFGDPPNQDKYLLVLKKGHNWDWINGLIETEEPI